MLDRPGRLKIDRVRTSISCVCYTFTLVAMEPLTLDMPPFDRSYGDLLLSGIQETYAR